LTHEPDKITNVSGDWRQKFMVSDSASIVDARLENEELKKKVAAMTNDRRAGTSG
jgi:hypothetical protein